MPLPKQSEIELPLLKALIACGGEAKPVDLYPKVQAAFPEITEADAAERLLSTGGSKWKNRVQWVRQKLMEKGEMESGGYGIWRITDSGRTRAKQRQGKGEEKALQIANLYELWDSYEDAFKRKLLDRLQSLTAKQFEDFAREFLSMYGFVDMEVTGVGADGGIDGHGALIVGLAKMKVAFQCKKWDGNISRTEIDKFRGATQGEYQQGIFFTTSDFTKPARQASIKQGAIPIVLINGEQMVKEMIEKDFGVTKRPLYLFEEAPIAGVDEDEG